MDSTMNFDSPLLGPDGHWIAETPNVVPFFGSTAHENEDSILDADAMQDMDFSSLDVLYSNGNDEAPPSATVLTPTTAMLQAHDPQPAGLQETLDARASSQPRARAVRLDWNQHKAFIEERYLGLNWSIADTLKALEEEGFSTSERKLKEKLRSWGFDKNLKPKQTRFIRRKFLGRERNQNRKTEFIINGAPVPTDKVTRHCHGYSYSDLPTTETTPSAIAYRTPKDQFASQPAEPSNYERTTTAVVLEWNGHTVEDLQKLLSQSIRTAEGSDENAFLQALPGIQEAIDGLEALMGPTHLITVRAIDTFGRLAVQHEHYDEAEARLLKSKTDHEMLFGPHSEKTFRCLARLGLFYGSLNRLAGAEKLLKTAIDGLNSLEDSDPENKFLSVAAYVPSLISVLVEQRNFEDAETILWRHIEQVDLLGNAYAPTVCALRYRLVHLYRNPEWSELGPDDVLKLPHLGKLVQLLESLVDNTNRIGTNNKGYLQIQSPEVYPWILLMEQYMLVGDHAKLLEFCNRTEGFLATFSHAKYVTLKDISVLKTKLVRGLAQVGERERAELWLVHQQSEVDDSEALGPDSLKSFEAKMHHALFCLRLGDWEHAEALLREAQDKAQIVFGQDHVMHGRIAQCLKTKEWPGSCDECGIYSARDFQDHSGP